MIPKKNVSNNKARAGGKVPAVRPATTKKTSKTIGSVVRGAIKSVLEEGGGALGTAFAGPAGGVVGRRLGSYVSKITGMGDYKVRGNSLTMGTSVPVFSNGKRSVIVRHAEYLMDVVGTTAFSAKAYNINPGELSTFPWLSTQASLYQQYRIHGMVFEFKSTSANALNSTNTALGTVIMGTQYDVTRPDFLSKLEMENHEFSTSCRPCENMLHPIECAPSENPLFGGYVKSFDSVTETDPRFTDLGRFQIATVGMQAAATIGELWVSYEIELMKPRLDPGGPIPLYAHISNAAYDATNTLGVIQRARAGSLPLIVNGAAGFNTITFPPWLTASTFLFSATWAGNSTAVVVPTITFVNASYSTNYGFRADTGAGSNNLGTTATMSVNFIFNVTGPNASIQITGGTLPTTPAFLDVYIIHMPYDANLTEGP